ncbi:DivIVA domain-containing protein [Spiroplasma platyhelix]|uniref:DivIVA domain-containing protein n=1 Tax=Spiroplasma platyhelix PALS-1 TaxID=1276218 RepID=A0A846U1C3_9MOLU|nr:DivIVA domain-containing protein [Spiroplasma platyhelix]MBE4703936.1 Cell cycle protein GpsB [Spiroplasma platyhelix PALS-1]NKE38309.1 DivIVA domain-containing protein [Spiroplasma platyhelix PALS-1]UJB29194.1 hypothetical protein SPLAT_v1c04300 [Spiroplasma platyhelix PALS-1]
MNVKNINIKQEILDKEFTVEYKGYNASEVDQFLDWLTVYFELLEKELKKIKEQLSLEQTNNKKLVREFSKLKESYSLLKEQKMALEAKGVENVDIITRLSKLETIVNED